MKLYPAGGAEGDAALFAGTYEGMEASNTTVSKTWSATLDWLLPRVCSLCGESGAERDPCEACEDALEELRIRDACTRCAAPMPPSYSTHLGDRTGRDRDFRPSSSGPCPACVIRPPSFDAVIAPWRFGVPLSSLVHRMKYRRDLAATAALGGVLARTLKARNGACATPDAVIGVPLSTRRLVQRGFNHAEEIAATVRRELELPNPRGIRITRRHSLPQARARTVPERFENVADVFRVVKWPDDIRTVAVVDDVLTTGATASALAELLRARGVRRIEVWCCARTPPK